MFTCYSCDAQRLMEEMKNRREAKEHWARPLAAVLQEIESEISTNGWRSITHSPREYRIARSVTPDDLVRIANLPFEILLSDHQAGLTLLTGDRGRAIAMIDGRRDTHSSNRTREQACFTLHNHPHPAQGNPSSADLFSSAVTKSDIDMIVGGDGLILHKTDLYKALRAKVSFKRFKTMMTEPSYRLINLDKEKGYIDKFIPWRHSRLVTVCSYINGEISWEECEKRIA